MDGRMDREVDRERFKERDTEKVEKGRERQISLRQEEREG